MMNIRILITLMFFLILQNNVLSQKSVQDILILDSNVNLLRSKSSKNIQQYRIRARVILQLNESYIGKKNKFGKKKASYDLVIVKDSLNIIKDSCFKVLREYWNNLRVESDLYKFDRNMSNVSIFKSLFILNDTILIPYFRDISGGIGSKAVFYFKEHLYTIKLTKSYPGFGALDSFIHNNIYCFPNNEKLGSLKFVKHIDEANNLINNYFKN